MVIVFFFSGFLVGSFAAAAIWLSGYGIGSAVLAYSLAGSMAVIALAVLRVLFVRLASWWWARSLEFRFMAITVQTILFAALGILTIGLVITYDGPSVVFALGIVLLLLAPFWLTLALDYFLARPEPRRCEDYL